MSIKTMNIIGCGNVGRTLGKLFADSGAFLIQDVHNRSLASAQAGVAFIGAGRAQADLAAMRPADVFMLSVLDDQIDNCCAELARNHCLQTGNIIFHCSGALSSRVLQAATEIGAKTASVHPIRSFADPAMVAENFSGTFCGIEGDADALTVLLPALAAINARSLSIHASTKTLYHAASVFACNYPLSLIDLALRAYVAAGIPEQVARELAQPLIQETIANAFRLGPALALTGPIARDDMAMVAKHQSAVDEWDQDAGRVYQALVEPTKNLARRKRAALRENQD